MRKECIPSIKGRWCFAKTERGNGMLNKEQDWLQQRVHEGELYEKSAKVS